MAVNVTQLAAALRLGDGTTAPVEPLAGILTRLGGVADAFISLLASDAPSVVKDESKIRFTSYLYDMPSVVSGDRYAAAWRNSGAAALVANWIVRRVVVTVASDGTETPVPVDPVDPVPGGTGVTETRVQELIQTHTDLIAAHHIPSTAVDADEVRAIIADSLAAGDSRGVELARSLVLPTGGTTSSFSVDFVLAANAPAGVTVAANTLRVPRRRTSDDVLGIWAVSVVGGAERDEVFIPWGGGGFVEETDTRNEYSYHGLSFDSDVETVDRFIDVVYAPKRTGNYGTVSLSGDGDTLPANSRVFFYLALSSGVTVTTGGDGGGGDGVDQTARDAASEAQSDIDEHEAGPHNTDQTARDAAAQSQSEIDTHEAALHNTDQTARAAASQAQTDIDNHETNHPTGGGGGGVQRVTALGTPVAVDADLRGFEFPTATADLVVDAWDAATYSKFLIAVVSGTGTKTHTQLEISRIPTMLPNGTHQFQLVVGSWTTDVVVDLHISLHKGSTNRFVVSGLNAAFFAANAIAQIYGIS